MLNFHKRYALYFFGIFNADNGILTKKAAKAAVNRDKKEVRQ